MPDLPPATENDHPEPLTAQNPVPHPDWEALVDHAEGLTRSARAGGTRKAYRNAWGDFCAWCSLYRRESLPADPVTVAVYLADRSKTHAISTLRLRLVAIRMVHRATELPFQADHPSIRDVWAG